MSAKPATPRELTPKASCSVAWDRSPATPAADGAPLLLSTRIVELESRLAVDTQCGSSGYPISGDLRGPGVSLHSEQRQQKRGPSASDSMQNRFSMRRHGSLAIVAVLGLLGVRAFGADVLSPARQNELLQSGIAAFDQAVAVSRESPQKASELYRQAAGNFEALIDAGVRNESIEFNLGNTHFRLKDLGRAILHYRRALLHAPGDARVAANLAYAREKVEPQISATGETQLVDRLLFWNRNVSRNARCWLAALASIAGWGFLLAQLRWRRLPLLWLGAACVVLGLASSLTVYVELNRESRTPAAVVVMPNSKLRQGRGENYEPILKQSLGSGVEVTVLDRRADWCEVQLVSGQTGWLPATAIVLIR